MWNLESKERINQQPYVWLKMPEHPNADKRGYVLEHRVIFENELGRLLTSEEVVHHINGVTEDNRIENLEFFSNQAEHARYHAISKGIKMVLLRCPVCRSLFRRRRGHTHLVLNKQKVTSCSKVCATGFSWDRRQLGDDEIWVKHALENNVVLEYVKDGRFDHSRCVG